jgi:hypothetical protein
MLIVYLVGLMILSIPHPEYFRYALCTVCKIRTVAPQHASHLHNSGKPQVVYPCRKLVEDVTTSQFTEPTARYR